MLERSESGRPPRARYWKQVGYDVAGFGALSSRPEAPWLSWHPLEATPGIEPG